MHTSNEDAWQVYSPSSLISTASERLYTEKLLAHYQHSLLTQPDALEYLSHDLGLNHPRVLEEFRLGFADRTLSHKLSPQGTFERDMSTGLYQRLQLFKGNGHEALRGMIVVPLFGASGELVGAYGKRKAAYPLEKQGETYWAVSQDVRGYFFNQRILGSFDQVILCETPFDVMSFYLAGVNNAISLLDFKYFDEAHINNLLEHKVSDVTVAFSRTPRGDRYCSHIRNKLQQFDIKVNKLQMVVGESVNSIWAKSRLFEQLTKEIAEYQCVGREAKCPSYFH